MSEVLRNAGPWVLAFLLQASLIAFVAVAVGRMLEEKSVELRVAVYRAGFGAILALALLGPSVNSLFRHGWIGGSSPSIRAPKTLRELLTRPSSQITQPDKSNAEFVYMLGELRSPLETGPDWPVITLTTWLAGLGLLSLSLLGGFAWIGRLRRTPILPSIESTGERLAKQAGIKRPPIAGSASCKSAFVAGIWRPTIYIPQGFADQFDDEQIEAILCHEVEHIRNRDHLWTPIARFVCALTWPCPLTWVLARGLTEALEERCDAAVLARGIRTRTYADSLLKVAEIGTSIQLAQLVGAGAFPGKSQLSRRLHLMLNCPSRSRISPPALASSWGRAS